MAAVAPEKSYADAVEAAPPVSVNGNGINGTNGNKKENVDPHSTNSVEDETRVIHSAKVLKIINTGTQYQVENKNERPSVERQESKYEYTATVCVLSSTTCHTAV